ncbi:MAG: NAD(P)-binding protein [Alphaproteobacteria bacterium]|nr:NAD(P)-binding protein [Alphaproteobacteria bacterium]
MRDARYDVLFEPVQIGPVKTRNRFYQVPHCTGMGYRYPNAEARFRGIKAEGGWGVVSTQEVEIHPTSDLTPYNEGRLWDDRDIPALEMVTEAVHAHGSLAAIQLVHNGHHSSNRMSRLSPMAPSVAASASMDPVQARAMSLSDIKDFRKWHVDAARRAKRAGFDIVYVYAGHDMSLLQHFLLSRHNHRSDDYGGSFTNRLRLFREVIADTKDAVGDSMAIAVRLAVDELMGEDGLRHDVEGHDIIAALAEEPDLWDVNLSDWSNDSQTARFTAEGYQNPYTGFVKSLTSKPVVGVGRYTSPDAMVAMITQGHLDLIGAARPSIADPFLPHKIEHGLQDQIRECIGCNICVSGDNTAVPMRCTQNPAVGEEWRRGWHPEHVVRTDDAATYLIVGGGPAGLEAAQTLAKAGQNVKLAEAGGDWGGRVTREARLPGLSAWGRVRDWRLQHLTTAANVEMYLHSPMTAEDILAFGADHVVLATGARWRDDGVGKTHRVPLGFLRKGPLMTPDDVMAGALREDAGSGPIVIYDDDQFYLGSVLAEAAAATGREVIFITPASMVAPWSDHTLEQMRIQKQLIEKGITIMTSTLLSGRDAGQVTVACVYSGQQHHVPAELLIPVTSRLPNDELLHQLNARNTDAITSVTAIGDAYSPGLIAMAVYSGHDYAMTALGHTAADPRREDVVARQD